MRKLLLVFSAVALAAGCGRKPAKKGDPGLVGLEGSLGNKWVPADTASDVVARLHIHGAEVANRARRPINLALVIDTSGSMEGDAIVNARAAANALVDALADGDRLAVIAFHSRAEIVAPAGRLGGRRDKVKKAIAAIEARGTTDLAGGLQTGLNQVMQGLLPGGVNRIVLLGDGVANDPAQLQGIAQQASQQGIAISALGLGLDYDETQLAMLAKVSGGAFHYVKESKDVATTFASEVLRLHQSVARNVQLVLTPGPGVVITRVAGLPQPPAGPAFYNLGDLAEGEERDIVVRMSVPARARGAIELLDAVLSFDDATGRADPKLGRLERRAYMSARPTADAKELKAGENLEVLRAAAHAQAADDVLRAVEFARMGDLDRARVLLDNTELETRAASTALGDVSLVKRAEDTRRLSIALPSALPAARMPMAGSGGGAGAITPTNVRYRTEAPGADNSKSDIKWAATAGENTPAVTVQAAPAVADPESANIVREIHDEANHMMQNH